MSGRTLAILLGILTVLVAIAYWDEQAGNVPTKGPAAFLTKGLDPIVGFELHVQGSFVKVDHQDGVWKASQPRPLPLQSKHVDRFLQSLRLYQPVRDFDAVELSLSDVGLGVDQESDRLVLLDASGGRRVVHVGVDTAVGYHLYLKSTDWSRIYMGSRHLRLLLKKRIADFRDRAIFSSAEIKALEGVSVRRSADGFQLPVNYPRSDHIVERIQKLMAVDFFLNEPLLTQRESEAKMIFRLTMKWKSKHFEQVEIYIAGDRLLVNRTESPIIAELPMSALQLLHFESIVEDDIDGRLSFDVLHRTSESEHTHHH